jgi:hypothetical protein
MSAATGLGGGVKSQPAAKASLPGSVLDVLALSKNGVNPRLLDGDGFHNLEFLRVLP